MALSSVNSKETFSGNISKKRIKHTSKEVHMTRELYFKAPQGRKSAVTPLHCEIPKVNCKDLLSTQNLEVVALKETYYSPFYNI